MSLLFFYLVVHAGNTAQLKTELARLRERLEHVKSGDVMAEAVVVDTASDPEGRMLSLLKEWRRQRLGALAAEVHRIEQLLLLGGDAGSEEHSGVATS